MEVFYCGRPYGKVYSLKQLQILRRGVRVAQDPLGLVIG